MIGIKNKHNLIQDLSILSTALTRVARFVVYLTPIGVFAISASAAGTMTVQEFGRLQAYFIPFILAAILFTFWILPAMVMACTPFKYKDIVGLSKDALITAFTTSNLFIILPVLIQNCNDLLEKYKMKHKDSASFIDIIVPVSFNFPNIGKLLALLFILFAAWFSGNSLSLSDYPNFVFTGLFSFFGSINTAMPFLLDILQIPSDFFQLYVLTGIINGNFATLLAAMNLLVFTLMATCAITGFLSINWKKLLIYTAITILLTGGIITGTRTYLSMTLSGAYTKDKVVAGMHLLQDRVPEIIHKTVPPAPVVSDSGQSRLQRIRDRGVIRVGYRADFLPFTFFNSAGDLVGFDIAMAHKLAKELGVNLEFIPVELETMAQQLKDDHFDIIMAGILYTPHRLEEMNFSEAYLDVTIALVVKDHRRKEFASLERMKRINGLKIGVYGDELYFASKVEERLPKAKVVGIKSIRDYFEHNRDDVDALLAAAEPGAAWTLLYPDYSVVVPKPDFALLPLGYPIAKGDQDMVNFLNHWIDLKKKDKTIEKFYNYWILGRGAVEKKPRWSVIRNVLHWVD
jgi:ABC-type amino acid transport substrate-binding protein